MYKVLVSLLFILSLVFSSFANPQAAKLKGVVNRLEPDGTKTALPGVTLKLTGALISSNAPLEAVSDEEGRFAILDLLPGDYTVNVELEGFEAYSKAYKLLPGTVGELDISLKISAVGSDTVEVLANDDNKINSSETTNIGAVKQKELKNAPLVNERFQDALPLLPGVVRGPDGLLNIKGARSGQSGLLVNSTNVTDPVTGDFAISLPIEAIESVSVLASPYSAEYGKFSGAVTAIGTRSGGDSYKFLFTNFFPRLRKREDPITGEKKIVGLESFTPRFIITGPIIKKKLTFSQSLEYRFIRTRIPSLPDLRNDTKLETFDSFTQVDYTVNERNRITFNFSVFPQNLSFINLNTFNSMEVTPNFRQRGFFGAVAERVAFENGSFLEVIFGAKKFDAFIFPQDDKQMFITQDRNLGNFFNRQDRFTDRYDTQLNYSLPAFNFKGTHSVKIGTLISFNTYNGQDQNSTILVGSELKPPVIIGSFGNSPFPSVKDFTGNTVFLRRSQQINFVGNGRLDRGNAEQAFYIQDKYNITSKLIFDIGLRYDHDDIAGGVNFAPRFGFLFIPGSDGKTAIRGGVGRFYDKVQLGVGAFEQLQSRSVTTFASNGITVIDRDRVFLNKFANDLRTPYSISTTFEVDRELIKGLFLRFGYQRREGRDEFIVDPTSTPTGSFLFLSNGGRSRYQEFQFTSRYKVNQGNEVLFSYVRSRATGDLNDFNTYFGNFRNPIIRANERSRQPFDTPNRFLITGSLKLPFDLMAFPVLDLRTGFPFSKIDDDQNFVGTRNSERFPRFASLDMQITKGIKIPVLGKKYKTKVGVKIFNITNHFNPRDVQSNIDSFNFRVFSNSVSRTFRGKFEFDF
ncbi:MAG: TonB-dependent receptor [Acidobacteria bacterium]|nr:TonB-dependent receptor [Acidobacteriota bacterium]